jgi:hypothetical protein
LNGKLLVMPVAATPEAERARREKIAAKLRGRTLSEETRRRMSESAIIRSMEVLENRARSARTPDAEDLLARA